MHDSFAVKPLVETSFAEALAAIEAAEALSEEKRRYWLCSLRVIARALDRPPALIPARWTAVRLPIGRLHHAPLGVTAKTLTNHRANVRAALAWLAREENIPPRGAPLRTDWQGLRQQLTHFHTRANLSALMRYCSARGIGSCEVDEAVVDVFMAYRAQTTALAADAAARRRIARAWNSCVGKIEGWPAQRLDEPPPKRALLGPDWDDMPAGLRRDIESYLNGLKKVRRNGRGRRIMPCKPTTINVRRAKLLAFIRRAVQIGFSLEQLGSLHELLAPEVVERVLDSYWPQDDAAPTDYTIDLGSLLVAIARQTECLDKEGIERLDDMRARLEEFRSCGLTPKNRALIRQVLTPGVWSAVVALPETLMGEARAVRDRAPTKAAVSAQMAVAVAILTVAPVRLGNLGTIRIGENLIRPGGLGSPYWLVYSSYDVKNRMRLEFPFDAGLTRLIDEYVRDHLHVLLRGGNEPWLFPGEAGKPKHSGTLSPQITNCIAKATGLRVTVHQFRHAAAALILRAKPGNYEFVRRILGHRNIQTTLNFYVGLETTEATRAFARIIRDQLTFEAAEE